MVKLKITPIRQLCIIVSNQSIQQLIKQPNVQVEHYKDPWGPFPNVFWSTPATQKTVHDMYSSDCVPFRAFAGRCTHTLSHTHCMTLHYITPTYRLLQYASHRCTTAAAADVHCNGCSNCTLTSHLHPSFMRCLKEYTAPCEQLRDTAPPNTHIYPLVTGAACVSRRK